MTKRILIAIALCFGGLAMAQDKPVADKYDSAVGETHVNIKTDVPVLTAEQKLAIREAQLAVSGLTAEKAQLENRYKDIVPALEKAQKALEAKVAELTPKGFVLQGDMTLKPEENPKPKP